MKNKTILFSSLFLLFVFTACKSKKEIVNSNKIEFNRNIKFIPESTNLTFDLTRKENMPFSEYDFGAELYNGKIYAFLDNHRNRYGNEDNNHGDVCVYDIKSNSWNKVNVIPKSQPTTTSVLVNDKIYLIGSSEKNRDLIQVYNITNNEWEESFNLPIGLYWTTVETHKQSIYVMGGYCPQLHPEIMSLNNVQIYNTQTKEWIEGATMPRRIQSPNSLKYKDEFYVWDNYPRVMYKYNPKKNMWISLDKFRPYVKGAQEGLVLNNKLYFISGQQNSGKVSKAIKKIYEYNPKTNEYLESLNNLITGRHYNYGAFGYKDKIYLLGGREDQNWDSMSDVIELTIKN